MFFLLFLILFLVWIYFYLKLYNPFQLTLIVGKKGSGKSTTATMYAKDFQGKSFLYYDSNKKKWTRQKWQVYTNMDMYINGVRIFENPENLGNLAFPPYSFVIIDEVNLLPGWDNRDFKNMNKQTLKFFRLMRKHRIRMILISQTFDIDKKIRALVDSIYLSTNFLGIFTLMRKVIKSVTIKTAALDADSQIVDDIKFAPWYIPGNIKFIFIPKFTKFFKSYDQEPLPFFDFVEVLKNKTKKLKNKKNKKNPLTRKRIKRIKKLIN